MSFSDFDATRRTRKGNFLNQIDHLIDWAQIEKAIGQHYAPASNATGRPAYPGLLLFKMLLVGIWNGGLSDEAVDDMANANLHVMRFLGLKAAHAWDGLLEQINRQINAHNIIVTKGCHVDASITQSPRKPKINPSYEVVNDREDRDDEDEAKAAMRVIEVTQPGVDTEARWVKKSGEEQATDAAAITA